MSPTTMRRCQAAILALAPAVMIVGFLSHPHIGNPVDPDVAEHIAAAVASAPTQWAVSHLLVAVGSGLLILAFLSLRACLREEGENVWSAFALPFIVLGSVLYALLPAMEFAPLAASRAGVDAAAVQEALFTWFFPTIMISAAVFLVGTVGFAAGIVASGIMDPRIRWIVAVALVVVAASRFVPLSVVQFHVQGVAGLVAFWPLAYLVAARPSLRAGTPLRHGPGSAPVPRAS